MEGCVYGVVVVLGDVVWVELCGVVFGYFVDFG